MAPRSGFEENALRAMHVKTEDTCTEIKSDTAISKDTCTTFKELLNNQG